MPFMLVIDRPLLIATIMLLLAIRVPAVAQTVAAESVAGAASHFDRDGITAQTD